MVGFDSYWNVVNGLACGDLGLRPSSHCFSQTKSNTGQSCYSLFNLDGSSIRPRNVTSGNYRGGVETEEVRK